MWNTLVVVPYDIMPDEIHWSWYHMTHYQVLGTGRGTIWHITRCDTLVVVTVPQPVSFTWQCVMQYYDQCNLAICHTVPQPVYLTWQYAIRYHNQCLSPGNVSCDTGCGTAWHIARLHFSWYRIKHCQVKYTDCGTVWHIARLHWSWYRMTHFQVKYTGRGTIWHNARWNTLVDIA
jgi:hypothetical protein